MLNTKSRWFDPGIRVLAVVAALLFTSLVLVFSGANPFEAYWNIIRGSVGSVNKITDVLVNWVPLLIATAGLLITFTSGLWNIGVEGQITVGAIFTTLAIRLLMDSGMSPALVIIIGILAGALGGALWALLVGVLKIYGGVSEIFGGLGLNFVATALTIYLIFGPWKRPGTGSMSGTLPFRDEFSLPTFGGYNLSLVALFIGIVSIVVVYFLLSNTYFGLRLKAVGKNGRAAFLLGVPTNRYLMMAFALGGMFAGMAGAIQVTAVYHRLIPSISSGYGFLGMLVAMLVNYQAIWAALVALFFAALNIGSIQLPLMMRLDSTLSGVIQGALVLAVLMMDGVRRRLGLKK
jgi:general nucleoside transport system permease protein